MRIISGKFKNKKINFHKNTETRPLKDSVRESIFNILKHSSKINFKIENSKIIDFYAGTGSFGLECLSRKASHVIFVEKNLNELNNLEKNIDILTLKNQATIIKTDVLKFLKNYNFVENIDLAFFDPPYKDKGYIDAIKLLKKLNCLSKDHIILLHREKNSKEDFKKFFKIIENRIYGRSEIFFCKLFLR